MISAMFARLLFCGLPAAVAGLVGWVFHPFVGLLFFACMFGFGWDVTRIPKRPTPPAPGHEREGRDG